MDSNTRAKLQQEHDLLAERARSSRAEANQIRTALKQKQSVLNQAETEFNEAQTQLTQLENHIQSLQAELIQKKERVKVAQQSLNQVHQQTAALAQSLGPVAQKQKRFEDALAMVVQNLGAVPPASKPAVRQAPAMPPIPPKVPNSVAQPASIDPAENRAPRRGVEMSLSFEIVLDSESEHNFYTGLTDNISEGGVFIATTQILDIGTKIKFPLALPSMLEPEEVEGIVRWVRREGRADSNVPSGIGIQFIKISDKFKARINQYIQSSDTIFYDD